MSESEIPKQIIINELVDSKGFTGRECPKSECGKYFKVALGSGLQDIDYCICAYCGHKGEVSDFITKEQIEHALSVAEHLIGNAVLARLKKLEFDHPPVGPFGIGFRLRVRGQLEPIPDYIEKELETEVVCDACTLRYAIYGVFAFCPDCSVHNSYQILEKNLEMAKKKVALAESVQADLGESLIADALENAVSAFDGFGRELCRAYSANAMSPSEATAISFQNSEGARKRVMELFGIDFAGFLQPHDWHLVKQSFQKRHLLAHKMGIVDEKYLANASDPQAELGRKLVIVPTEVLAVIEIIGKIGVYLHGHFSPRKD